MSREDRMKASDVFRETEYVFSKKKSFEKAFPEIKDVVVEVEESGDGIRSGFNTHRYTKNSIEEYINCSNSLCYNGGFSIGSILREMIRSKKINLETTRGCQGYEGSPKGRRHYRYCINSFKIKVHVEYKNSDSNTKEGKNNETL